MQDEKRIILSAAELHLLMLVSGNENWDGFPLPAEETGLREMMIGAFLKLCEKGLVTAADGKYAVDPHAEGLIGTLCAPDRVCTWQFRDGTFISAYIKDEACVMLGSLKRQPDHAEIYEIKTEDIPDHLEKGFGISREMMEQREPFPEGKRRAVPSSVRCLYAEKEKDAITVCAVPERSRS